MARGPLLKKINGVTASPSGSKVVRTSSSSSVADPGFYFNGVHFRVGPPSGRVKVRFELDLKKNKKNGLIKD
uniref:Uncharacterized protein n=1 Tax=Helianthus annuus TaxID=4232 RepID=A0A251V2N7_HELAN